MIQDPVYEIRAEARSRIRQEFGQLYSPLVKGQSQEQTARVLQLLDPASQEDKTLALQCLKEDNLEFRYYAAVFLQSCGILEQMLSGSSLEDRDTCERTYTFLKNAVDLNVCTFIKPSHIASNSGALFIAIRLLGSGGDTEILTSLAGEIFAFLRDKPLKGAYLEIYTLTLESIRERGNAGALGLLKNELFARRTEGAHLALLLPRIPPGTEAVFFPLLRSFFTDSSFPEPRELIQALGRMRADLLLPEIFKILDSPAGDYPDSVRASALELLASLKLSYCLFRILENLSFLSPLELGRFGELLKAYPPSILEEKARILLVSPDAKVRAALFAVLSVLGNRSFIKDIREALTDSDPDLRIAAMRSLLEFGEIRLLNQETSMLRDPVERVRAATASVIGQYGDRGALEILQTILKDPNEVDPVKESIIRGLGFSSGVESLDLLIFALEQLPGFLDQTLKALCLRRGKRDIARLVEVFKDSGPELRKTLMEAFKQYREDAENDILEILKDDVISLKPYLAQILEETGYIEQTIRKLSHRDAAVRRKAALWLSLMDTLPAFRGLVRAAKDPDQEVRVLVVRGLEKLNTPQGKKILDQLREDPDSHIRKYTHWALERLDSLAME
jgi:HEAT repeat protein